MKNKISISIGLLSASIIAFQLNLMHLLSVIQWSHFAYMVISVALLGFGASGTLLALTGEWFQRRIEHILPGLMILTGASMSLLMLISPTVFGSFDSYLIFVDRSQISGLLLTYFSFFIPFFFGALAIGLVYIHHVDRIGPLYFADLSGSGVGGLLMIFMFWLLYPVQIPAVISLLPIIAGTLIIPRKWFRKFILLLTAAIVIPAVLMVKAPEPPLSEYKGLSHALNLPGAGIVIEKKSPYGHIHVVRSSALRFAPGLSLSFDGTIPVRDVIFSNANWFGPVIEWSRNDSVHFMDYTTNALPFVLNIPERALILDAGTGLFASHALTRGVAEVTAVEQNRVAVSLLKNELAAVIDSMYHIPQMTAVNLHSRSYLLRDTSRYDLIVLPVIETFGGTSGINALEEQYIFTLQAFDEIWNRLTDSGMIAVTAWMDYPPRMPLKLLATLCETHEKNNDTPIENHLVSIRGWSTITYILKKSPLNEQDITKTRDFCNEMYFDPVLLPGLVSSERTLFNRLQDDDFFDFVDRILSPERELFYREYDFNIKPATDSAPYFSRFLKLSRYSKMQEVFGQAAVPFLEIGYMILLITFIQITIAAILLILLPLLSIGWKGGGKAYTMIHFGGIGMGFMFVEIILIQQFILYFGNPIYAAAAVLSGMLICSGGGSLVSSNIDATRSSLVKVLSVIVLFIVLYVLLLVPLLRQTMNLPLVVKILFSVVFISPAAFFMGMPFPLGLRVLSVKNKTLIPWAWGINGCLSVISTALATIIAVQAGFMWVMLIAAMTYGLTMMANIYRT